MGAITPTIVQKRNRVGVRGEFRRRDRPTRGVRPQQRAVRPPASGGVGWPGERWVGDGPVGPPGGGPALEASPRPDRRGQSSQGPDRRRARESGPPRRAMYRREAGLGAWRDRPWPTRARGTAEASAVRVLAGHGGGGRRRRAAGRRGCLSQSGERQGRVNGPPQQLAQRALGHAAIGRRGEHVFEKLLPRPDGRPPRSRTCVRDGAGPRNRPANAATDLARAAQREPSEDQISIFVRIFSTTASTNSVVPAEPPRSIVLTPPAVVSSTDS